MVTEVSDLIADKINEQVFWSTQCSQPLRELAGRIAIALEAEYPGFDKANFFRKCGFSSF